MNPTVDDAESPNVGYLKDLWHAIQTQDISGKDALIGLSQRSMSTPYPARCPARTCRSRGAAGRSGTRAAGRSGTRAAR